MKNLSAILRLSLSETFTVLITLVVCLAGFIAAEVNPEYRKQYSNPIRENLRYSPDTSKVTGDELEGRSYNKLRNFPESSLDLVKRQLANIGESDEYEQKENYGYGYDDDDYDHFNFKRSDTENISNNNNNIDDINRKLGSEFMGGLKAKPDMNTKKMADITAKQKANEIETIEMLNFKETHTPNANENPVSNEDSKKFNKKPSARTSLKMSDFRENSAIDEKIKENKEESALGRGSSQSKIVETKKVEEKEATKLKDPSVEVSEKKEKEVSLKDDKQAVASKSIKETSDDKEKVLKLSDTSKLEENEDKLVGKTKEAEVKLKGGTEDSKITSDMINPIDLSDKGNGASFVSSDYKDDSSKASAVEGEEKNSEESTGVEPNNALNKHQQGYQRNGEALWNMYIYSNMNSGSANSHEVPIQINQELNKPAKDFSEYQGFNNDLFRKQHWRDPMMRYRFDFQPSAVSEMSMKDQQQSSNQLFPQKQEYSKEQERALMQMDAVWQSQQEQNADSNRVKIPYGTNLAQSILENTDYHKNFLKSLKRYKTMGSDQRNPQDTISGQTIDPPLSNTPGQSETELKSDEEEAHQNKHTRRETTSKSTSPQVCVPESQTSQAVSSDPTNNKARTRRKSQKLEYEIKVINRNPHGDKVEEFSHGTARFEKDLKAKSTDRFLKKYPYSQVSRDDLMNLVNLNTEIKTKRKAPIRKRHDQKSLIQPRAVPSGYYGNRVKFGQKNLAKNNERNENPDLTSFGQNIIPSPSLRNQLSDSAADKSKMQRSWEARQQEFKHETMKRFDSNETPNKGNSVLLVRKSDQMAIPFDEETSKVVNENKMKYDNLAKILTGNSNYIILGNPRNEQLQKLSDTKIPNNMVFTGYTLPPYNTGTSQLQNLKKDTPQELKNKGLFVRSSHTDKEERKASSGLRSPKSNLKKTFEKFRDLAGFFKDNEQESSDNQYQAQELKEGRDIVFSEDKLPDPIVINSDGSEKFQGLTPKPLNSIYSISTNFKTLDQQDKKTDVPSSYAEKNMFAAEEKPDNLDSNWEPALKNAFPEAKSVNAITKNGNEIIILDLNRTPLKPTHPLNPPSKGSYNPIPYGSMQYTAQMPFRISTGGNTGERLIQVHINPGNQQQQFSNNAKKNSFVMNSQIGRPYMMQTLDSKSSSMKGLPALFRALMDTKTVAKRSLSYEPSPTQSYDKIFKELNDQSNENQKKLKIDGKRKISPITYAPTSFSEISSYGQEEMKSLENILQNIMSQAASTSSTCDTANPQNPDINLAYKTEIPNENLNSLHLEAIEPSTNFYIEKGRSNLWEELPPTFGNRLRREETEKQNFGKDEVSESNPSASSDSICQAICLKTSPDLLKTQSNEISDGENQLKSEYENQLNEFLESLYKSQKEPLNLPNENTWKRKKRKEIHCEKRSAGSADNNKVSTTAEPNTISKNLAEDNDQSVYSPGIKRRLFSTNNEADDADNNGDAIYEHDKGVLVGETERKCVKNSLNKCIDPMILEIFRNSQEKEEAEEKEEKVRSRRSLNTGFHSNFKREIDLDESMPNDFQNFLVTSVGGFGSQTREALKKDDALWEGKANYQDGASEPFEDSSLAKRDVSSMEKQKTSPYNKRFLSGDSNSQNQNLKNVINSLQQTGTKTQSQKLSGKNPDFRDDKLPTQIRIQISNASAKEKKSSKPIMDESETTSTETETLPKEKEFLDKNKAGTIQDDVTKLRNPIKNSYSFLDYDEPEETNYKSTIQRRKKKKKFVPENPTKTVGDFLAFDQRAMESLLRRILTQQDIIPEQTTHRSPIGNHLPQVETVYNPTQETNKAQLGPVQFRKMIAGDSNAMSTKNNFREMSRTNLGDNDKLDGQKNDEVSGWTGFNNFKQGSSQNALWDMPNVNLNPSIDAFENGAPGYLFPFGQKRYHHKSNNYFSHASPDDSLRMDRIYDTLKLRQDLKSHSEFRKQHRDNLMARNNLRFANENYMTVPNAKSSDTILSYENPWTNEYLPKSSISSSMKSRYSRPFIQGKPLISESLQRDNPNNDYLDGFEDDYSEWLDPNEPLTKNNQQVDDLPVAEPPEKFTKPSFGPATYQNYYFKNSDADDEDEEETEEDYGENLEDEDLDDFSMLVNKNSFTSEHLKNHGGTKSSYLSLLDDVPNKMSPLRNMDLWDKRYETLQMNSPRTEAKFISESPEEDIKPDFGLSSGSSSLLRNANSRSNILKNNVMKNIYNSEFDDLGDFESWRMPLRNSFRRKVAFRHRRRDYPKIDNRVFYATKSQFRNADPDLDFSRKQGRQSYRQNSLNAAFADPDNNFENESEENGKRFSDSFLTLGKNSQEDWNCGNENMELGDVTENLEDARETISEDNILENVIGKYIVRKRVASPADLSRTNESPLKKEATEKHKITRRALEKFVENAPVTKLLTKRLSSGHLTEKNFRKYHKKNLNKVLAEVTDSASLDTPKEKTSVLMKRSALDIFKKITNKDHESKKMDSSDCRSAGFEPLSSLNDKKYETPDFETLSQLKKLISTENQNEYNSIQFKPYYPMGVPSEADLKKKEKLKSTEPSEITMQGPWKVELIDNWDKKKIENPNGMSQTPSTLNRNRILAFSSVKIAPQQNADKELPSVSGSFQKEVGISYGPKYDEVRGSSERHFRKRSLDSSLSSTTYEDAAQRGRFAKSTVTLEEKNRALHDKRSLSAGDSIPESTHVLQRSAKKIRSFVNTDDNCQNAGFPSRGSLNKRKSVFPPSNIANILKDNGHINEETSKYLGQQIVDAIWSHVSENPKLKELIAPALAVRMTANKEDVGIREKPMEHQQQQQQQDISDQLQNFLQKFMNDLERLAEKDVKKRMCNKIDAQSKQFLQTLLNAPLNPPLSSFFSKEKMCQCPDYINKILLGLPPNFENNEDSSDPEDYPEKETKKHFLTKLLEYKTLSNWEKDSIGDNHDKLLKELNDAKLGISKEDFDSNASEQNNIASNCEAFNSNHVWCPICKPLPKKPPPKDTSTKFLGTAISRFPSKNANLNNLRKSSGLFFDEEIMKHAKKLAGKSGHYNAEQNKENQQMMKTAPQGSPPCQQMLPIGAQYMPEFPSRMQVPQQDTAKTFAVHQGTSHPTQEMSNNYQKTDSQEVVLGPQKMSSGIQKMSQMTHKMTPPCQKMSQETQEMLPVVQNAVPASQNNPSTIQQMSPCTQQTLQTDQQMMSDNQQMMSDNQQKRPNNQEMSSDIQQINSGNTPMMLCVQQTPPPNSNVNPTYIFEPETPFKAENSQRKEYTPFETEDFATNQKQADKSQNQVEGVSDQQNQKQQQNPYRQSQQPFLDLSLPQNFTENVQNFQLAETAKSSDESQSQNSDTITNSDTVEGESNVQKPSELKKDGDVTEQQESLDSRNTISSRPNSIPNSEDKFKRDESPVKDTASLKKPRSTQDQQFHFRKISSGISPWEHLKPKFEAARKKRILLRSKNPSRFHEDQAIADAGISSSLSDQESPETDDADDSELEYLSWSAMPAVRRQLNNLQTGFEFDEFFSKIPKLKKA